MSKRKNKERGNKSSNRIPTLTDTVVILPHTIKAMLENEVSALAEAELENRFEPGAGAGIEQGGKQPGMPSQPAWPDEQALAELRASLTTQTIDLASQLLHGAVREMEAALLEQVLDRMKQQLPSLIDDVLSEQLAANTGQTKEPS